MARQKSDYAAFSFIIPSRNFYWYIAMNTLNTELEGREGLPFQMIDVFVDPDTGALLESMEDKAAALKAAQDVNNHLLAIAIRKFKASINEPKAFHTWTLEHKARWSREIAPQIKAYIEVSGENTALVQGYEMKLSFAFSYGLPDEKAIPEQQAMNTAVDALAAAYTLSDEELSLLLHSGLSFDAPAVFYDVTNPSKPIWRFIFTMPTVYCSDESIAARVEALYGTDMDYNQSYMAEIDAYTGEVIRTLYAPTMQNMVECILP